MKKILSFLNLIVSIILLVLLCHQKAFPDYLSTRTACELKDYHLNHESLFLNMTRPVFVKFWDSASAPVCRDDAAEQTQVEAETNADAPTGSCEESLTLDNVLEWTRNFGTFSNTVLEDSVLPRLPFFADKIRNATKLIADTWDPEAIKVQVYETWTNTFEPRIPVSVRTAWDDAFGSRKEEVVSHHDAAPTNTTMNAEGLADDLHIEVDAAIAFFHFAVDTATSSSMYKMAVTTLLQVMKHRPEFVSYAWRRVTNCPSDILMQHLFVLMVVLVSGIWVWRDYQESQNRRAEHRRQEERERQAEHQRQAGHQRQAMQQLELLLQKLGELTREKEPTKQFDILAITAYILFKEQPAFERLRVLEFDGDACGCDRIVYVTLRHVFNPDLNRLSPVSAGMRNSLTELYHLTNAAFEARRLLQPVDPNWGNFESTISEASKRQLTFDMLSELFFMGLLPMDHHFDSFRTYHESDPRKTHNKTYRRLRKVLHSDRLPRRFSEDQKRMCTQAELVVNNAAQAAGVSTSS
jgi:hypothetical protein